MDKTRDNIITISGTKDNLYDKAIFIIKPEKEEDTASLDFTKEADKILNNYIVKSLLESQNNDVSNFFNEYNPKNRQLTKSVKQTTNKRARYKYSTKPLDTIDKLLTFSIAFCGILVMYLLNTM